MQHLYSQEEHQLPQADRELLIVIKTKMERVESDLRDMKDTTARRVDALEVEKMNAAQAREWKESGDNAHVQFDERITRLERALFVVTGIFLALEFYLRFFIDK